MKTIEFTASDGNEYTIFVKNICSVSTNTNGGGTWVELSSGTKLLTRIEIRTLTKMIKGED